MLRGRDGPHLQLMPRRLQCDVTTHLHSPHPLPLPGPLQGPAEASGSQWTKLAPNLPTPTPASVNTPRNQTSELETATRF